VPGGETIITFRIDRPLLAKVEAYRLSFSKPPIARSSVIRRALTAFLSNQDWQNEAAEAELALQQQDAAPEAEIEPVSDVDVASLEGMAKAAPTPQPEGPLSEDELVQVDGILARHAWRMFEDEVNLARQYPRVVLHPEFPAWFAGLIKAAEKGGLARCSASSLRFLEEQLVQGIP
jgi:predicted transcriptional regulator